MKIILYMAMSVDGYIADASDDAPWSDTIWNKYLETVEEYGNIVVGRRTYEIMESAGDFNEFKKKPFTVVLSTTLSGEGIAVAGDPQQAQELVNSKGLETMLIGGGGKTGAAFLDAGLVDEVRIDIEPVLLGDGIPLLEAAKNVKLNTKAVEQLAEGVVHIEYEVVK